jgi:O-antigen/teichoic acid export membrane protein
MTLKKEIVRGIGWLNVSSIIGKAFSYLIMLLLAKLLLPQDFGLFAIATLFISAMQLFTGLGLGQALIYNRDNVDTATNVIFYIAPFTGIILYMISFISAPFVAFFFNDPRVESILKILAVILVIDSFGLAPQMLLEKELDFKRKFIPSVLPGIGSGCISIATAILGYGVWSLVYGQIVGSALGLMLIWLVSPWRPSFKFDQIIAKEMIRYGQSVAVFNLVIFIFNNGCNAIIGKFLGITSLGLYQFAFNISNLPATQITFSVNRVMFPAFSKMAKDRKLLVNAYLKTTKYVSLLTMPTSFGIFAIAPSLIMTLGEKWLPAMNALRVLCFFGLMRSTFSPTGEIFMAVGEVNLLLKATIFQLLVMLFGVYLLIGYNIIGVSIAISISILIGGFLAIKIICNVLQIRMRQVFDAIFPSLVSSLLMLFFIFLFQVLTSQIALSPILMLILMILLGAVLYSIFILIFEKDSIIELKNIIKEGRV